MPKTADFAFVNKLRTMLVVLFFAFVFLFFFYHANKILDPDLGWHLRAGADSIAQGKIIDEEIYNYPIIGDRWINHEWLADIATFFIYDGIGYIGLTLVFAAIFTLTLIGQYRWAIKKFKNEQNISPLFLLILLLQLFGLFAMLPQLGVRMQVLALPFLMIELILLENFTAQKRRQILVWLPVLFWIWANLHGSFLIGLFVVGFWLMIKVAEAILAKKWQPTWLDTTRVFENTTLLFCLLITSLCAFVTLLTPHGFELYHLLAEYTDRYYQAHIIEWTPAWQHPVSALKMLFFALVMAVVATRIISLFNKQARNRFSLDLWNIALAALFLCMALESKRHFPLFYLAAFPFLMSELSAFLRNVPIIDKTFAQKTNAVPLLLMSIGAIVILLAQVGARVVPIDDPFRDPLLCKTYPCAAVEYLQKSPFADERLFNDYGWGGYLLWMWDGKPIFIDGRQPQKAFGKHTFLQEQRAILDRNQTAEKLQQYDIRVVLLKNNPEEEYSFFERHILKIAPQQAPQARGIIEYLKQAPEWQQVFADETSIVFAKSQQAASES